MASASQKPHVTARTAVASSKWLALETWKYVDRMGTEREWDVANRTTKSSELHADGVDILAVLQGGDIQEPHILLVKQFRPPMDCHTIELPAGLIDAGESPAQAALRELKEETGYTGTLRSISPGLSLSPGLTTETCITCTVDVDTSLPENVSPAQSLEESEDIEVLRVPVASLTQTLTRFADQGCNVFHGLWALAIGLEFTTRAQPL